MRKRDKSGIAKFVVFVLLVVIYDSCSFSNKDREASETQDPLGNGDSLFNTSDRKSDSVSVRNLLITIYKWYGKHEGVNHINFYRTTAYGMDTVRLDSAVREMKKTGFFSDGFLNNYRLIGEKVNWDLKHDSTLLMVGIAFPFQDYDTWHGGQGFQPNWDELRIFDFSINNNRASLKWTATNWDSIDVRFEKEKDKWKLSFIELMDLESY